MKVLPVILLSLLIQPVLGQQDRSRWVDSVFNTMNRQAKAAQLFMVSTTASLTSEDLEDLEGLVKDGVGGIHIKRGGLHETATLINKLQQLSDTKLLIGTSAEWGLAQSLDSITGFSKPMVASATNSDSLIRQWSTSIAQQMKRLGFHINFAPNIDNEVFAGDYLRYFGDTQALAGTTTSAFVEAQKAAGIIAVAKHLPRRWSTERPLSDSMVVIRLDRIDPSTLEPLQQLISKGLDGILTSYLHFSMQNEQGIVPSSISQAFISEVLRKKLGFNGLVFSDVQHINKKEGKQRSGDLELFAFQTGADVILQSPNPSAGIRKIAREVRKNKILQEQLNASVRKILGAKYDAGLNDLHPVNTDNLNRTTSDPSYQWINTVIAGKAVTVVQNTDSLLPLKTLEDRSFVSISVGKGIGNGFEQSLNKYASFRHHHVLAAGDTSTVRILPGDIVVVGVFPRMLALEKSLTTWINKLAVDHQVILVHFGHPTAASGYQAQAIIASYTDEDFMPSVSAQVIFGGISSSGKLPVAAGHWPARAGITTTTTDRLAYAAPESAGVSSRVLAKIRDIMDEAIAMGATPGCYTLVAKGGKVIYEESAGHLTYDKTEKVTAETIYDLASVTKISATLQTVMFMHDRGLIDINKKISVYLPELKNSNKADFTIKDILTHQAGLWPFLPFWTQTMKENAHMPEYYSTSTSASYPFPVSDNLFASSAMKDSLWQWIIKARIREKPSRTPYDYRYSDMGFYMLQHLAEKILNQPMEDFLAQNLYEPIGAYTTGYLPLRKFEAGRIAPTERDTLFRKSLLVGYVHDQGAAMHGGIAGHAGLFSTANDLAKLGQLWLQKGHYGGVTFYKPETVELFTSRQFSDSRRGLGWDKPIPGDWTGPTARFASPRTFGHTGFTGTCIWVDPEFDLVYVFLSNRVQPDMNNNKLLNANIRPRIQQVIYEAIFDYCASKN